MTFGAAGDGELDRGGESRKLRRENQSVLNSERYRGVRKCLLRQTQQVLESDDLRWGDGGRVSASGQSSPSSGRHRSQHKEVNK